LINSLETEPDSTWEVAWSTEIERRVAEIDRGEAATISWADLRRKLWEGLDESDSRRKDFRGGGGACEPRAGLLAEAPR
jgi:hypothetical protein